MTGDGADRRLPAFDLALDGLGLDLRPHFNTVLQAKAAFLATAHRTRPRTFQNLFGTAHRVGEHHRCHWSPLQLCMGDRLKSAPVKIRLEGRTLGFD